MAHGALSHLDLAVADPQASIGFWSLLLEHLGYTRHQLDDPDRCAWWKQQPDGSTFGIEVRPPREPLARERHERSAPGIDHLAFHVASRVDVDDVHRLLVDKGHAVADPPSEYDYVEGYYALAFDDPNGIRLEVVHDPSTNPGLGTKEVDVPSAGHLLAVQLDDMWASSSTALHDLTDDEYFWEPTTVCWSVRLRAEAPVGWGKGDWVCEDTWPAPDPLPVTTVAWRVTHLAAWTEVYLDHAFGEGTFDLQDFEVPSTASGGVASLTDVQRRWAEAVRSVPAGHAFDPHPVHWGQRLPLGRIVSLMTLEHRHHLAEISLLRDLRRGHALLQPQPAKPDAPVWWLGDDG